MPPNGPPPRPGHVAGHPTSPPPPKAVRGTAVSSTFDLISRLMVGRMETMQKQIDAMQSQPRLQRVTPEAMEELEGDEIRTIAVLSQGSAKTMTWNTKLRQWHSRAGHDNPLEWQWFIDLSTIPEVQQ